MFFFLLLLGGGLLAYEATTTSALPAGLTPSMVASAVQKALVHETDPESLTEFATALAPYNAALATQLKNRAASLSFSQNVTAKAAALQAQGPAATRSYSLATKFVK